jgi:hypothetical protein
VRFVISSSFNSTEKIYNFIMTLLTHLTNHINFSWKHQMLRNLSLIKFFFFLEGIQLEKRRLEIIGQPWSERLKTLRMHSINEIEIWTISKRTLEKPKQSFSKPILMGSLRLGRSEDNTILQLLIQRCSTSSRRPLPHVATGYLNVATRSFSWRREV